MEKIGTQEIKTKRLTLRQFKKEDTTEVYQNYGSDKKITKYISWIPCNTPEKCEKFIEYNIKEYQDNPLHYSWTITYNNQIVGSIAIFNVDENNNSGELGYSLGSQWWKKGIMTEAAKAVLDYAFNKAKFNRIYASCHEDNTASKKVMKKLDMIYEGKLREGQKNTDNTYSNLDLYSILKKEYKN
ncbi:GNAT family protein [Methanosphaera sp. ISO3-F5]|uniref:GNAT family N-acetyltransferase n=1 Tax=Methanosphaera sp. ISO3-F5 TaxID=1452353 RepID=UPI002B25DC18|nr:GNAT family protein [Methanosphaera sp. ISO3-F5]WQH63554.1 GNAT family protein [Methanosphaera sp. ISO3-F5]